MCGTVPFCGFSAFSRDKFLTRGPLKKMHLKKIWDEKKFPPNKENYGLLKFQASPSI